MIVSSYQSNGEDRSGRWTLQQNGVVAGASVSALFCLSLVLGEKLRPYLKYFQPATQKICGARKCFEGYKGGPGLIWYPALAVLSPRTFFFWVFLFSGASFLFLPSGLLPDWISILFLSLCLPPDTCMKLAAPLALQCTTLTFYWLLKQRVWPFLRKELRFFISGRYTISCNLVTKTCMHSTISLWNSLSSRGWKGGKKWEEENE